MKIVTLMQHVAFLALVPVLPAQDPAPRPEPRVAPAPRPEVLLDLSAMHLDRMRMTEGDMMVHAKEAALLAEGELMRFREQALEWKSEALLAETHHMSMDLDAYLSRAVHERDAARAQVARPGLERPLSARPRDAWLQGDPADSLYRAAREALGRGEYRRAASLFNELTRKHARSGYAPTAAYWEAFARYRLGTTEELRLAYRILEGKGEYKFDPNALTKETNADAASLRTRVQGALAARGDAEAARQLQAEAAQSGSGCDREEVSVRAEALAALGQMDLAAAMPAVRKVLAKRDECTVELRRRALYLLGREPQPERLQLIVDVAKHDPDAGIRGDAMQWIARVAGDQATPLLEELLRTSTDERSQRSAINALGALDTDAARRAVRSLVERTDVPERVRIEAITALTRTRSDRQPAADDLAYLRALYPRMESQRLKEAVLTAVSRVGTAENQQFLWTIVRNTAEPTALRGTAMQRLGTMSSVNVEDLAKFYDVADARSLREQVLRALYERKEPEAVDKMMEIARKDTDPQIRRYAITLLARRNDPRAAKLLQELIDR